MNMTHEYCITHSCTAPRLQSRPGYVDEFEVEDVKFGPNPPLLKSARWIPSSAMSEADLEHDIGVDAKLLFQGGLSFAVTTKLWLNWPRDRYAFLPVRVEIRLTELAGAVRMGVRRHRSFVSFMAEPFSQFEVESTLGQSKTKLQAVKVES